jgi:hypothetical protein
MAGSAMAAHEFKVEGTAVGATPFEIGGNGYAGEFEGTAAGNSVTFICLAGYTSIAAGTNQLEKEGKSKFKTELRNCFIAKVTEGKSAPTECKVSEPIIAEATGSLVGVSEDKFTGKGAEELFSELVLPKEEKCALTKLASITLKLKGAEDCTIPLSLEENVVHQLLCSPAGSTLETGTEPARLWSAATLKLTDGKPWSST